MRSPVCGSSSALPGVSWLQIRGYRTNGCRSLCAPGTPGQRRPSSRWSTATSPGSAPERTPHEASRSSSGYWVGGSNCRPRVRDLLSRIHECGFRVIATSASFGRHAASPTGTYATHQDTRTRASRPSLCARSGRGMESAERQIWSAHNRDYVGRSRPSDCGRGEPRREPHRQE